MEDRSNFIMLSLVAIVAIVALVVLVTGTTSTKLTSIRDITGEGYSTTTFSAYESGWYPPSPPRCPEGQIYIYGACRPRPETNYLKRGSDGMPETFHRENDGTASK
ncbi:hypothetical protein J4410_02685 [Candidatus Woesearchaeota archaeon]|nr:hypothetical protein [Candidatus Woesearchaeota archaeon]